MGKLSEEKMNETTQKRRVQELLRQYDLYRAVDAQIKALEARLNGGITIPTAQETADIIGNKSILEARRQEISDAMRFDDPTIWIVYKAVAYQGTSEHIETVGAFIKHCAPVTHLCHKRLVFLQNTLRNRAQSFGVELDSRLDDLATSRPIIELTEDPAFIKEWQQYEFNTTPDGKPAKWKNYEVNT